MKIYFPAAVSDPFPIPLHSFKFPAGFPSRHFGGKMPKTMEEMLTLPGVGRKTANVVLGYGFGIATGIVVDVHNLRVNVVLGISGQKNADKMERELLELVRKKDWIDYGQWITWHGRRVCYARKPDCENCVLNDICPSAFKRV